MSLGDRVEVPGLDWEPAAGARQQPARPLRDGRPHRLVRAHWDSTTCRAGRRAASRRSYARSTSTTTGSAIRSGGASRWCGICMTRSPATTRSCWPRRPATSARAKEEGRVALVLTFEGCEALGTDPRFLDLYYRLGLRSASLTHTRRNIFADGCWAADRRGGLTRARQGGRAPDGRPRHRHRPGAHRRGRLRRDPRTHRQPRHPLAHHADHVPRHGPRSRRPARRQAPPPAPRAAPRPCNAGGAGGQRRRPRPDPRRAPRPRQASSATSRPRST